MFHCPPEKTLIVRRSSGRSEIQKERCVTDHQHHHHHHRHRHRINMDPNMARLWMVIYDIYIYGNYHPGFSKVIQWLSQFWGSPRELVEYLWPGLWGTPMASAFGSSRHFLWGSWALGPAPNGSNVVKAMSLTTKMTGNGKHTTYF